MPHRGYESLTRADRIRSALLYLWVLFAFASSPLLSAACESDRIDEQVRVSVVSDGDSLRLNDGRRLRLIGLDTPELQPAGSPAQAAALAAREQLRQLVFTQQQQLALRYDAERKDRYGRILAHAFTRDGRNLTALLLEQGLGVVLTVPPNVWQAECYRDSAERARQARRGVWALAGYQTVASTELDLKRQGWHRIRGRVSHLSQDPQALWLHLDPRFALRISRADLRYFPALEPLVGTNIEAQGWVYAEQGQLRMQLRYPTALYTNK